MKKNYFYALFASLMLFMAMPANAQVTMVDLYGKWKFTADIEWGATATEAQKAQISNECDVIIAADDVTGWYEAKIVGFAGSENPQFADLFQSPSSGTYAAKVANPNPTQGALFNGMLLANANGDNPYGVFEGGEWVVKSLGTFYYILNEDKTEMKVQNDFTIVTLASTDDKNPVVVATLRNAKMTFVEPAAPVAVSDISGDYIFKAGTSQWSTMDGSEIPTEFSVNIVSKSEDNKAYDATIAIEGYDNVTLPATFDGSVLSLAFNNSYIKSDYAEVKNSIRFADYYAPEEKKGVIEFMAIENAFSLSNGICLASDSLGTNKAGDADSTWVVTRQYYMDGSMKLRTDAPDFDWAGIYNVKVPSKSDVIIAGANVDAEAWPTEFQMEIKEVQTIDGPGYAVASLFGYELPNGGWLITPSADGLGAEVKLDGYYGMAVIQSYGGGMYLVLTNSNGMPTTLNVTLNEDASLSIESCFIQTYDYNEKVYQPVVFYQNLTAEKAVVEEVPAFDLLGNYKFSVEAVEEFYTADGVEYLKEFDVKIDYFDGTPYQMESCYYISSFFGDNSGWYSIDINVVEEGSKFELLVGGNIKALVPDESYYKIYSADGSTTPVSMIVNADGTLSLGEFSIYINENKGAIYKNAVLTKVDDTAVENIAVENAAVKGIFDMQGRKIENIAAPGLYIIDGVKVLVK